MKLIFSFLLLFLLITNCNKAKTVLICGDHICINKAEADQYFEENLSIEVKIIDKKEKKNFDLVELNLKNNHISKKQISIKPKNQTNKKIKVLSDIEIIKIKENIKIKKNKKLVKKNKNIKKVLKNDLGIKDDEIKINNKNLNFNVNKRKIDIVDVCTILEKCSIDEISKYLLKQGKKKDYPDITARQ